MSNIKEITSIERAVELLAASGNSIGYYYSRCPDMNLAPDTQITKGAFGLFKFSYEDMEYDEIEDCEIVSTKEITFVGILEEMVKHHITTVFEYEGRIYARDSDDLYMDDEASFEVYKELYNNRSYMYSSECSKIRSVVKFG